MDKHKIFSIVLTVLLVILVAIEIYQMVNGKPVSTVCLFAVVAVFCADIANELTWKKNKKDAENGGNKDEQK